MCIISMYIDQDMGGRGIFDHLEIVTAVYNKNYHTRVKKNLKKVTLILFIVSSRITLPLPIRQISFLYRPGYTENISKHWDTSLI